MELLTVILGVLRFDDYDSQVCHQLVTRLLRLTCQQLLT